MKLNKLFITIFLMMFFNVFCFAEVNEVCKVQLTITNVQTTEGKIIMSIHDSDKSFSKRIPLETLCVIPEISSVSCELILAPGEYAFCIYHDTNSNGELDTNLVGIPKEPFGFSNYDGKAAPGNFKKHKVQISGDTNISVPLVEF